MQDFTPEQIQERFNQLLPEMQAALASPDIHDKIRQVGNDHNLMIDQIGDLVDQVGLVMLGLAKSSGFVNDIASRLSIDNGTAREVAADINSKIFEDLKEILKRGKSEAASQETSAIDNASLEQAGGFEIEHDIPGNGEAGAELASREAAAFTPSDKADMMSRIENPMPVTPRTEQRGFSSIPSNPMTEPLVDQLLRGSAASSEQHVEMSAKPAQPTIPQKLPARAPQPPANLPTNDPYREAMK